jgi:hypothetical protein
MSIALLYERSENDEAGIKLTAQQLGIELAFIPFRKIALAISKEGFSAKTKGKDYTSILNGTAVVLNRAQSKNRRLQHHGNAWQKNLKLLPNRIHLLQQTTYTTKPLESRHPHPKNRFRALRRLRLYEERQRNPQ